MAENSTPTTSSGKSWWESLIEVGAGVYTSATTADTARRQSRAAEVTANAKKYISDNMTTIVTVLGLVVVVVVVIIWRKRKS